MHLKGRGKEPASCGSQSSVALAVILAALSMLSPFSIDIFFPSMRAMQTDFGVDSLTVQQLLTAYMVPYAAMSLVHGALSDAVGRRAVVLVGMAVYLVVSFGCVFAPSFSAILTFRAVQGLTAGVGITVGRAIIRDLYEGREAQRLMSAVTMIFGVAPAIAPVIGGWVHVGFGWRGVFAFLGLLSFVLLVVAWRFLPETHPSHSRKPPDVISLVTTSWRILLEPRFHWLALCNATLFATIWIYIGSAPSIVQDTWRLDQTDFSSLFFPLIGGYVLGALVSGRLAGRLESRRQLRLGLGIGCAGGVCALATTLLTSHSIIAQQAAIAFSAVGVQMATPVLTLRALDMFPESRGAVSSLLAFVQLVGATITLGVAPLFASGFEPVAAYSLLAGSISVGCALQAYTRSQGSADDLK